MDKQMMEEILRKLSVGEELTPAEVRPFLGEIVHIFIATGEDGSILRLWRSKDCLTPQEVEVVFHDDEYWIGDRIVSFQSYEVPLVAITGIPKMGVSDIVRLLNSETETSSIPKIGIQEEDLLPQTLEEEIYISRLVQDGVPVGRPYFSAHVCSPRYTEAEIGSDGELLYDGMAVEFEGSSQPVEFFLD